MGLQRLVLPYPEFRLGEVISPDEANANNGDIKIKIDEVMDFLSSITTEGEDIAQIHIRGNAVEIVPIAPFASDNIEGALKELIERIRSTVLDASGADLVGSTAIDGIQGLTVQAQLNDLGRLIMNLSTDTVTSGDFELHKESGDHDHRYFTKTETETMFYTQEAVDTKLTEFRTELDDETFTASHIEVRDADPVNPSEGRIWLLR